MSRRCCPRFPDHSASVPVDRALDVDRHAVGRLDDRREVRVGELRHRAGVDVETLVRRSPSRSARSAVPSSRMNVTSRSASVVGRVGDKHVGLIVARRRRSGLRRGPTSGRSRSRRSCCGLRASRLPVVPQYIARSETIGTLDRDDACRDGDGGQFWCFVFDVDRQAAGAGTVFDRVTVTPLSVVKMTVTSTSTRIADWRAG